MPRIESQLSARPETSLCTENRGPTKSTQADAFGPGLLNVLENEVAAEVLPPLDAT
jgi:hypothetical protein